MERKIENDEADLGMLFKSIGGGRDNFLAFLYGMFLIVKKFWVAFLVVLICGVALGLYKEYYGAKKYKTSLIIQTNQNSTEMVYNYLENMNSSYLEGNGFAKREILDLEVEAIPDFKNLLDNYENQNIDLIEFLLENASADDVLKAEFFRNSYRFHKLEIEMGDTFNDESITKLITLLNNVNSFKDINSFYDEHNDRRVVEFEKMLTQLNESIETYNKKKPGDSEDLAITGVSFRERNFITSLVEYKTYVLRFLERAKYDALTGNESVYLVNDPIIKPQKPFLPYIILMPLLFVFLFFMVVYFLRSLKKGKDIHERKQA